MRIGARLALGFFVAVALITMVGLVGVWAQRSIHTAFIRLLGHDLPEIIALGEIKAGGARLQEWALSLALEAGSASQQTSDERWDAPYHQTYEVLRGQLEQIAALALQEAEQRAIVQAHTAAVAALYQAGVELIASAKEGTNAERLQKRQVLKEAEEAFMAATDRAMGFEAAELEEHAEHANQEASRSRFACS